jgi:hypothetical protein
MTRQYVACSFAEGDQRTYTYHNDDVPDLKPGDRVIVETKHGEKTVYVQSFADEAPKFDTKPILRVAPPKEPKEAEEKEGENA